MAKNKFLIFTILVTAAVLIFGIWGIYKTRHLSFAQKRSKLITNLDNELKKAVDEGNYRCCIEPPCKMCYLGNWIWDDGICRCDDEAIKGNLDKVCPECKAGIKEGRCKNSKGTCPINLES